MQAILFFFLTLFSSRDSRIVYDTPSPGYSGNSPEIVMVPKTATEATYRFAAFIEMQPGEGCEYDTVLYFMRDYVSPGVVSVGKNSEIKIRKDGSADGAEIPATVFRVKAGSHIGFHVEYMVGGHCKTRPTYRVFPILEQVGAK
jgi:hypothetical protein